MKSVVLLSFCILLRSFCQEPLSNFALIDLGNLSSSKKTEASVFERSHFKKFQLVSCYYKHIYRSGDVLVGFQDFILPKDIDLSQHERELVGEVEEAETAGLKQKSYQIRCNNLKFVVREVNKGDENFYYFCSGTKNGHGIKGIVLYKTCDSTKASQVFTTLLKRMKMR